VPEKVIACGFDTTTVGVLSRLGDRGWSVYLARKLASIRARTGAG
jgi:hypothetical protein